MSLTDYRFGSDKSSHSTTVKLEGMCITKDKPQQPFSSGKRRWYENYFKSFERDSYSKVKGGLRSEYNVHLNTALLGCPKMRGEEKLNPLVSEDKYPNQ